MKKQANNKFFYRVLCGFLLGLSIIAPGISGSIMAVMLGIYDDLIEIVSNPFKNLKKNILYVFPMGIGAGISMLLLLQALRWLFANFPVPAYLLFISLIAGSIPTVIKEAKAGGFKVKYIIGILFAFAFALTIGFLGHHDAMIDIAAYTDTALKKTLYYSLCGAIAGCTGMIPGMSVSMMLMMLGVYEPLLEAAAKFDVLTVAPVGVCFVVAMVLFSNLTKLIFKKFRGFAYFLVLGFMSGSIVAIFPGLPKDALNWTLSAVAIALGIAVFFVFKKLGEKWGADELPSLGDAL